uniref:Transmembrane protein n=1 Tax=Medicago truncatula TaxID=3880 RepID=I3SVS6_MEDTR|nr:unknown [Medicago truncatula]
MKSYFRYVRMIYLLCFFIMNCNIVDVVYKFLFNVVCLTVEKLFIIFKW